MRTLTTLIVVATATVIAACAPEPETPPTRDLTLLVRPASVDSNAVLSVRERPALREEAAVQRRPERGAAPAQPRRTAAAPRAETRPVATPPVPIASAPAPVPTAAPEPAPAAMARAPASAAAPAGGVGIPLEPGQSVGVVPATGATADPMPPTQVVSLHGLRGGPGGIDDDRCIPMHGGRLPPPVFRPRFR